MDAVIKVGGSLAEAPEILRTACKTLGHLGVKYQILVVPGGGEFADVVRDIDRRYSLNAFTSHKMAVLGMDQYGFLLSELIPNSRKTNTLEEAQEIVQSNRTAILLPFHLMAEDHSLEASWNVTSDSIAAHIANQIHAEKLILITNVDGVFTNDPKADPKAQLIKMISSSDLLERGQRTCVDKFLPISLLKTHVDCYVINGSYPDRIGKVLANERTICTQVLAK